MPAPTHYPGRHNRQGARAAWVAILVTTDLSCLAIAGIAAFLLWAQPMKDQPAALYLQLTPLLLLFVVGNAQAGLYPGLGLGPVETLRRLTFVTTFGFLILTAFSFALKLPYLYSRMTFGIAFILSVVLLPLGRAAVQNLARRWTWWGEPTVVIGSASRAAEIIRGMQRAEHIGYRPVACLATDLSRGAELEGVRVVGGLDRAASLADRGLRVAFIEAGLLRDTDAVDRLQHTFRHVVLIREHDGLPVEGLQVRNLVELVGIEFTNNLLIGRNRATKRLLEVAFAAIALPLAGPVIAIAALLVRIIDGAPSFYLQDRAGLDGVRFAVPKIRTMKTDAAARLEAHLAANPDVRAEWTGNYKLKDDPRLLPVVGAAFRRFSVDELPQLWSVLNGSMSLIGPRPFPDYHLEQFTPRFLRLRQRVRPGITGLWQVSVRSAGGIEAQEAFDSYYIRNWSIWLDIYILSRTIAAVLSGRGAY